MLICSQLKMQITLNEVFPYVSFSYLMSLNAIKQNGISSLHIVTQGSLKFVLNLRHKTSNKSTLHKAYMENWEIGFLLILHPHNILFQISNEET